MSEGLENKAKTSYIYTLKAILDMNEIYDSGDCQQIRREIIGERSSQPLPKYVALEEYRKLEKSFEDTQKEIEKLKDELADMTDAINELFKSEQKYQTKSNNLEAKVEAANKLLDPNNFDGIGQNLHRGFVGIEVFDGKLTLSNVQKLINEQLDRLDRVLEIPRNRELNATEQYADACKQIEKQRSEEEAKTNE